MIVEQFSGIVKQCLWNGAVDQWNSGTVKVQQCWRTVLGEQWKGESGTLWWNSGTVMVEQ